MDPAREALGRPLPKLKQLPIAPCGRADMKLDGGSSETKMPVHLVSELWCTQNFQNAFIEECT